jgi:hypothetical protein
MPNPLEAKLDATGEMVTLLSTCDWKGHAVDAIRTGRAAA